MALNGNNIINPGNQPPVPGTPPSNHKAIYTVLIALILILSAAVVYLAMSKNTEQPNNQQTNNTQPPGPAPEPTPAPVPNPNSTNPTANWKSYNDTKTGISFKYPVTWSLNNYNKAPNLTVHSTNINSLSTSCGELGDCQQEQRDLQTAIENGTAPAIISFEGGKGSLQVSCSGNEGGDLVPTPFYTFKFFKADMEYSVNLNDLETKLNTNLACNQQNYITKINSPNTVNINGYQTYNDLLTLIKDTLVLK